MRIVMVKQERPFFRVQCLECFTILDNMQPNPEFYADLDGLPFKAYYCKDCIDMLGRGITIEI